MKRIITLTSDLGTWDTYVAQMKASILGINIDAVLVDLCHTIEPQDIDEAAFHLRSVCPMFPPGTIHMVAVDPGGGDASRAVALEAGGQLFVGPDNGVFRYVLAAMARDGARQVAAPSAVHLTREKYFRATVCPTFRGRDVFAPVAAHLSIGVPLRELGAPAQDLPAEDLPEPTREADGSVRARVLHIDRFGNVITNVTEGFVGPFGTAVIEVGDRRLSGVHSAYLDVELGQLVALIGSSGYLEISAREGNAASELEVQVGDDVVIRAAPAGVLPARG